MLTRRPLRYAPLLVFLVALLEGCGNGTRYASFSQLAWDKAGGTEAELKQDRTACREASRVGSATGSDDPQTLSYGQPTPEQSEANRLYEICMKSRGWWAINPR
jgi:hypothetical protein